MSKSPSLTSFDHEQAAAYDDRFAKLQPLRDALHLAAAGVLLELPSDARILCVGAGTGAEILALGARFPGWHFTAVEPSEPMLGVFREKAAVAGILDRCEIHEGYLDSLPETPPFQAATSILVSQFLMERDQRRAFFREIARRLMPGGHLVSADLSAELGTEEYERLFGVWGNLFGICGFTPEQVGNVRNAYGNGVAVSPPGEIEDLIASAGFGIPLGILQTVMIRAWWATTPLISP